MSLFQRHTHGHSHDHAPAHSSRQAPVSRRSFFFLGAAASAVVARPARAQESDQHGGPASPGQATSAMAPESRKKRDAPAPRRREIFDAHLHCPSDAAGQVWQWHPVTKTFAEFDAYLTQTGVQRGIINNVRCQMGKTANDFVEGNREVARYCEKYKGRFLGACVVNPLFIDEALREMEECRKRYGMVWVGELCNYTVPYRYGIKEFEMLVDQAVKLNMVLDVHTTLPEMEYVIGKFPRATIVFPHFGGDADIIFKRIDDVAAHPNTYLDTSGSGHDRVGMLEYAVQKIGADRVLFGSDFSINCPATVIARVENAFISDEQKDKILSRNLEALLAKAGWSGWDNARA